ncbi:MAG TPA: ArsR family transcriptional regulator [Firmicutes bacterium]|nr:ArsR family transcriptional regulator [Bacillota bacterium]
MSCANVLKALGDPSRLQIMCLLSEESLCVCHIESSLNISQSSTSKQLMKLKTAGLIVSEKKGQWVHYAIPCDVFIKYPFLKPLIELAKSENLKEEPKGCCC